MDKEVRKAHLFTSKYIFFITNVLQLAFMVSMIFDFGYNYDRGLLEELYFYIHKVYNFSTKQYSIEKFVYAC